MHALYLQKPEQGSLERDCLSPVLPRQDGSHELPSHLLEGLEHGVEEGGHPWDAGVAVGVGVGDQEQAKSIETYVVMRNQVADGEGK